MPAVCHLIVVLLLSGLVACTATTGSDRSSNPRRPNILLIMADDLGFECLSCNGSEMYQTPHLDALAASGLRFAHAHAQPICTPSRVQIMTGIYNNKNYIRFGLLDPEATTFANLLRDAGYATCIAGKWQLKGDYAGVKNFGFDRHCLWQLNRLTSRYPNPGLEIDGQRRDFKNGEFGPDLVTDYLCRFFEERQAAGEPFFAYYPMILPHWPFVPTPGSADWDPEMWRDRKREPGGYRSQKYWSGFVRYTDKMVGKLLTKLGELGMREDTLVIFTGDNGTYTGIRSRLGGRSYQGGKGSTRDAGTHVPFLLSWPGQVPAGELREDLVDLSDVLPTLCEVAGAAVPEQLPIDGVSLVPTWRGGRRHKPYVYCWYQRNGRREKAQQLVRDRRFKLYATGEYFDVVADPLEQSPLQPEDGDATHRMLREALNRHLAATRAADPIIRRKRARFRGK